MLLPLLSLSMAKELTLSFDDGLNPELNTKAIMINHTLLQQLALKDVKVIIYPSLIKTGQAEGLALIADWGKQGHKIGNHSDLHLSLNKDDVTLDTYIQSIENADKIYSQLEGWTPRYRFPYLKEGNTIEKRDGVRKWLSDHKYKAGDVSIDASDWYYNQLYLKYENNNDHESIEKLKKSYIAHILEKANYYDQLAFQIIERSPKHVFLLHVNQINANFIGDIIDALRQDGWVLIDSDTAYSDPIYQSKPDVLPAGESLIWALAKQKGIAKLRYPAEDAPYEKENLNKFGLSGDL